jgi:hypothetical protein
MGRAGTFAHTTPHAGPKCIAIDVRAEETRGVMKREIIKDGLLGYIPSSSLQRRFQSRIDQKPISVANFFHIGYRQTGLLSHSCPIERRKGHAKEPKTAVTSLEPSILTV